MNMSASWVLVVACELGVDDIVSSSDTNGDATMGAYALNQGVHDFDSESFHALTTGAPGRNRTCGGAALQAAALPLYHWRIRGVTDRSRTGIGGSTDLGSAIELRPHLEPVAGIEPAASTLPR